MTPFGFHALTAAWLFLLVVPLVLFYFLKLKRPRQAVPSIFLWRQVLHDRRVNSPFQRFKRNVLLLLQLLLLLLVVLAAMLPFWRGRAARVHRLPVLIDCSASMAALDRPGGLRRLDAAKQKVRELIDGLLPDQELCLLSFARTARRRTPFTSDQRLLRQALDAIAVEDVPSDVEDALRMAQALARSEAFDEVFLYSDGNFPARADFELSFKLHYQRLDPGGPNLGLTGLNATRTGDGDWHVFLSVEGTADTEATARLDVTQDEQPVASERLTIPKGRPRHVALQVRSDKPVHLQATLTPDGFDSMPNDNAAYLDLPAARPLWVYAPPSLAASPRTTAPPRRAASTSSSPTARRTSPSTPRASSPWASCRPTCGTS
jgi:hypothetical protein